MINYSDTKDGKEEFKSKDTIYQNSHRTVKMEAQLTKTCGIQLEEKFITLYMITLEKKKISNQHSKFLPQELEK